MYVELLFATLVVLSTYYMCYLINEGSSNDHGSYYRLPEDEHYVDSSSESGSNQTVSVRSPSNSGRWSTTTWTDESDRDIDEQIVNLSVPEQETEYHNTSAPEAAPDAGEEISMPSPPDSPIYHVLVREPQHREHAKVPWIENPLFKSRDQR